MAGQNDTTKEILLGVGCGCLTLVGLCCGSGGVAALVRKSSYESAAQQHAELFLGFVQRRDWAGAFGATQYPLGTPLSSPETFQSCVASTPLADLASFTCTDVDAAWVSDDGADVTCTIVSASQGSSDVTIDVNSPDDLPYLGFVWFSPNVTTGPAWHSDSCATWSGREYYRDPPPGRVRP